MCRLNMDIKKVIRHFGTKAAAARAAGVFPPQIHQWLAGKPISDYRQLRIEKASNGAIKADAGIRKKWEAVL